MSAVIYLSICQNKTLWMSSENKSSAVAEMGDRMATTDMGRKLGVGYCAPFRGDWVPI